MDLFRKLTAPIVLRFQSTDDLQSAMWVLERRLAEGEVAGSKTSEKMLQDAMLIVARELIRRKVVFWT